MSNRTFSISDVDADELNANKELYGWYHDYLPPIPTLFNAKLGDNRGAVSFAVGEEPEAEPLPDTMLESLLSPAEVAAMESLLSQTDETAESPEQDITEAAAEHPAFSESGDVSFGLFGDGYDKQTGVPKIERPGLTDYLLPRGVFNKFNAGVTNDIKKDPPALNQPDDYFKVYQKYFSEAEKPLRFGGKIMGFKGFPNMYETEDMFGWQRVAGTNPRVLMGLDSARLTALLAKMPLTDAHLQAVAGANVTLAGEAAAARLYYCDYHLLDGLPLQQGRYMYPAIGVFWSDVRAGLLRPVAIQLSQKPGRIHTPASADWASARASFQTADFNYHEMGTHLSEAHFAQEAFVIASRRTLCSKHPIGALLQQIHWALVFNNALGRMQLVNPGGYTDRMMAGDLDNGSLEIVRSHYAKVWQWDDWNLEKYIARQGTGNTAGLPVYPYRDDGLPLWTAIQKFATAYVDAWYSRDAEVATDRQLENFVNELNDPEKGNLLTKGFPQKIMTKAELAEVVARLVWQAGPGHGGINYSQFQYFGAVASSPGAGYADCNVPEGQPLPPLKDVLPPIAQTIDQDDILCVITQRVFGRLGEYQHEFNRGLNDAAQTAVSNFQTALAGLANEIDHRNKTGLRQTYNYVWLHPHNLPNSTNI